MKIGSAVLIGFFMVASLEATAQKVSFEKCLQIREEIEEYDTLRRRGGSARAMEEWKQERKKLEEQFRKYGCSAYGREVK